MDSQTPTPHVSEVPNPTPSVTPDSSPPVILSSTGDPSPIDPKPSKKFPLKLIIGIILFLLLAGGAAAGYVNKDRLISLVSKPTPSPTVILSETKDLSPTPTPTTDWRAVKTKFLDLKIPQGLHIINCNQKSSVIVDWGDSDGEYCDFDGEQLILISKYEKKYTSINEAVPESGPTNTTNLITTISNVKYFDVNGYKAASWKRVTKPTGVADIQYSPERVEVFILPDIFISFDPKEDYRIQQYLSTLNFTDTETIDTSNWKTYSGNGFSFNIPKDWYETKSTESSIAFGPMSTQGLGKDEKVDSYVSTFIWFEKIDSLNKADPVDYVQISDSIKLSATRSGISIDGVNGLDIHHVGCQSGECRDVIFQKGDFVYHFSEHNKRKELDYILNSFKFTK